MEDLLYYAITWGNWALVQADTSKAPYHFVVIDSNDPSYIGCAGGELTSEFNKVEWEKPIIKENKQVEGELYFYKHQDDFYLLNYYYDQWYMVIDCTDPRFIGNTVVINPEAVEKVEWEEQPSTYSYEIKYDYNEGKEPKACSCDLFTVLMRIGCQCGGK